MHARNLFRNGRFYLALFLALGVWLLIQPSPARAETITVTQTLDAGAGTLRQAIADANPGDTIVFTDSMSIYLNSELAINKTLTVDGSGHRITVSGDSGNDGTRNVRVFYIATGSAVTLSHLSIVSGTAVSGTAEDGYGGSIYNAGALTVENCTISGNAAYYGGGGIYNAGALTVENCTISGNASDEYGGGIFNWGSALTVLSSTVAGNAAYYGGGGIINFESVLTVENSTIADNVANYYTAEGGGILSYGALTVKNSRVRFKSVKTGTTIRKNKQERVENQETLGRVYSS